MKKEIYCLSCKLKIVELLDKEQPFPPGEHVKYVDGIAKGTMVCDFCNMAIYEGQECCGFSNWIRGQEYEPWEEEFIRLKDAEKPKTIKPKGVYPLLITGDDDQLMQFTINTSMVLNFFERRLNTVYAMCMSESLELVKACAERLNITLQYIDHVDGAEVYKLISQGSHALWQEGGYKHEG